MLFAGNPYAIKAIAGRDSIKPFRLEHQLQALGQFLVVID
jgi:hypothetical protein